VFTAAAAARLLVPLQGTRHLIQPLHHNASVVEPSTGSEVTRDRQSTSSATAITGTAVATGLQRVPKIQQSIRSWMAPLICIVDTWVWKAVAEEG